MTGKRPTQRLSEFLPSLAAELESLLRRDGEGGLASQVSDLRVQSRCECGDDFCATIYTGGAKPDDSIDLEPPDGILVLDLDAERRIVGIEILYRPDYKRMVDALFAE